MFDVKKLSVWIVTYNRPDAINRTIQDFLQTTPSYVPINVISNHSNLQLDQDYGPRVKIYMNILRPDQSWGYLARNWNQCFYFGFKEYEWVLCSQDDVRILPGWLENIQQHPDYDFYTAPYFDVIFMINRHAFRQVGWFDERFVVMDYQDNDFFRRCYQRLGKEKISSEDKHGWQWNGRSTGFINPIGQSSFWRHGPDEGYIQPDDHPRGRGDKRFIHNTINANFLYKKWGATIKRNHQELNLRQRIPDIDWYPWFTKEMFALVNEDYPHERFTTLKWWDVWRKKLDNVAYRLKIWLLGLLSAES